MPSLTENIQRRRYELKRRELVVVEVSTLSPHFLRLKLSGDDLADFVSASFDDHVKLFIPGDEQEAPIRRDYTPRSFDPVRRELTLELALHSGGPGARWADQVAPGQTVAVGGPRGSFVVPVDFDWHLLVGDETALPAIARRLEELPSSTRAIVHLHVADSTDQRPLTSAAQLDLRWVSSSDALIDSVRSLALPSGEGYAWCAGEAATIAQIRRVLVDEKGHDRRAIRAAAYWKRGANAHHEVLENQ